MIRQHTAVIYGPSGLDKLKFLLMCSMKLVHTSYIIKLIHVALYIIVHEMNTIEYY